MKSFTASTHLGIVKVHLPDLPGVPSVMQNGQTLASGVPITVEGPALLFATEGEPLICTPAGQPETRQANEIVVDGEPVAIDASVTRAQGVFAAEGLPVVWGARLGAREASVRGFTFNDGVQVEVNWQLDLVPIKRKCCGRS